MLLVRRRGAAGCLGLMAGLWRCCPELRGRDTGEPGGLIRGDGVGAAQLRPDHAHRAALRPAEDDMHAVFLAPGKAPRAQPLDELPVGGVRAGERLAVAE